MSSVLLRCCGFQADRCELYLQPHLLSLKASRGGKIHEVTYKSTCVSLCEQKTQLWLLLLGALHVVPSSSTGKKRHHITSHHIWSDLISSEGDRVLLDPFSPLQYKSMSTETASLILEDGTAFKGRLFGANVSVSGEVGKSLVELSNMLWRSC